MAAQKVVALGTKLAVGTTKTATKLGAQSLGGSKPTHATLGIEKRFFRPYCLEFFMWFQLYATIGLR